MIPGAWGLHWLPYGEEGPEGPASWTPWASPPLPGTVGFEPSLGEESCGPWTLTAGGGDLCLGQGAGDPLVSWGIGTGPTPALRGLKRGRGDSVLRGSPETRAEALWTWEGWDPFTSVPATGASQSHPGSRICLAVGPPCVGGAEGGRAHSGVSPFASLSGFYPFRSRFLLSLNLNPF